MGKGAGAGGGEAENLKAMCKRRRMAALAAIFDIVMDRVIIRRDRLKRGEMRLGHSAARDCETLADREVLEPAIVGEPVPTTIEPLAHGASGRRSTPSAASRSIGGGVDAEFGEDRAPMLADIRGRRQPGIGLRRNTGGSWGAELSHAGLVDSNRPAGGDDVRVGEPVVESR